MIIKADHGPIRIHVVTLYLLSFSERVRRGAAPVGSNFLNIISSGPIGLSDADVYYCQGLYGAQSNFREGAQVTVRGINPLFFQLPWFHDQ